MISLLQSVRGFLGFIFFITCLVLSFKGFPLGLLSFFGSFLVLMGYQVATASICHTDAGGSTSAGGRIITICIAFFIASLGSAIINWGGLATVNFGDFSVSLRWAGILMGLAGGLWNIDYAFVTPTGRPINTEK